MVHVLACVTHPAHRTILTTCYATGLRISEAVRLTISAVDSQRMVLRVDDGKGHQDRDVMLSPKLLEILRDWWRMHRPPHWFFPDYLVRLLLHTRPGTSCGRGPWERRDSGVSRETASEAPKSAAGHGPAAYDRQIAGDGGFPRRRPGSRRQLVPGRWLRDNLTK